MSKAAVSAPSIDQHVTFVYSAKFEETVRFYEQTLGLSLVLDQGACRIYRVAAEAFLGICRSSENRPAPPGGVILTFVTHELPAWHQRLVAAGAQVDGEPRENSRYRIVHFFVHDPDGRSIEFQRFLSPEWPDVGSA
jgi:catechol 2,3-dioxygenase-like lactoylglutathione lyase family enzyme